MRERQTKQKNIIYGALKALDHPTATEVFGYVHERYPSISRATVFRVLGGFAENGRASEVRMAGSDARYDYRTEKHFHAHCVRCGKIIDILIPAPAVERDYAALLHSVEECCEGKGFVLNDMSVEFFGVCSACSEKERSAIATAHIS